VNRGLKDFLLVPINFDLQQYSFKKKKLQNKYFCYLNLVRLVGQLVLQAQLGTINRVEAA
jgi:hypothetical protein